MKIIKTEKIFGGKFLNVFRKILIRWIQVSNSTNLLKAS